MRKLIIIMIILALSISLMGCNSEAKNKEDNASVKASIAGISLEDSKDIVEEILGKEYNTSEYEEAGHFPEKFYSWQYENGTVVYIGKDTGKVLEIRSNDQSEAETNLGIKIGDKADLVLETYRAQYIEPESFHGNGVLSGLFKVEEEAVIIFDFNVEDGIVNPTEIKSDDKVERIILTYPSHIDEKF